MLGNLRLSTKLLASSIAFSLPIAVLFYFFLTGVNASIRFSTLETEGNRYQRPLEDLLTYVPEYARLLSERAPETQGRRADLRQRIDDAFDRLEDADVDVGVDLQFTPDGLAKRGKTDLTVRSMRRKWDGLDGGGTAAALVADIKDMIVQAGNTSNLILDPDLDSYYIMDVTLLALPQTQGRIADILDFGSAVLLRGNDITASDRLRFSVYGALLEESDYNRTVASTRVALTEDPNFYGVHTGLQQTIPESLDAYQRPTEAFIALLEDLGTEGSLVTRERFLSAGNAAKDAALAYWKVAVDRLDDLLFIRIGSYLTTRMIGVTLTVLSILVAGLLVWRISRGISISVAKAQRYAEAIAGGDLLAANPVDDGGEVGTIGRSIQALEESFREILGGQIRSTVEVITGSILHLTSSSQEISTTSNQQAAAVKEIVSTMEDSDRLSKGIAEKITGVTDLSDETRDKVNSGFEIITANRATMEEIKTRNDATIDGIQNLAGRIENIFNIVSIIHTIANQTKIIAFNAELEASSAGAAGKNFEIVATEIRRLADSTGSSTGEIRGIITEIQKASEVLLDTSRIGTEKIQEGLDLSNQLQTLFKEILAAAELSAGSAGQIAALIRQQVQAFEQILMTLKQISQGIDGFVTATRSTTQTSEGLRKMASDLEGILGRFRLDHGPGKNGPDSVGADETASRRAQRV